MLYLDTHVVVWLYAGDTGKFNVSVVDLLNGHDLLISPIVRLELQYLFEIDRISATPNRIMTDLSERIGLGVCQTSFDAVVRQALGCNWTRDPFDRLIVAQAALNHTILVTKDTRILGNYPKAVW